MDFADQEFDTPRTQEMSCLGFLALWFFLPLPVLLLELFSRDGSFWEHLLTLLVYVALAGAWMRFGAPRNRFLWKSGVLYKRKCLRNKVLSESEVPKEQIRLLVDRTEGSSVIFSIFTESLKKQDIHRMPKSPYSEVLTFGEKLAQALGVPYRSSGDGTRAGSSRVHHHHRPEQIVVDHLSKGEFCLSGCGCWLLYLGLGAVQALESAGVLADALSALYLAAVAVAIAYRYHLLSDYHVIDRNTGEVFFERRSLLFPQKRGLATLDEIDSVAVEGKLSHDRNAREEWHYGISLITNNARTHQLIPPNYWLNHEEALSSARFLATEIDKPLHATEAERELVISSEDSAETSEEPVPSDEETGSEPHKSSTISVKTHRPKPWWAFLYRMSSRLILLVALAAFLLSQVPVYQTLLDLSIHGRTARAEVLSVESAHGDWGKVTYEFRADDILYQGSERILKPVGLQKGSFLPILYLPDNPKESYAGTHLLLWRFGFWQRHLLVLGAVWLLNVFLFITYQDIVEMRGKEEKPKASSLSCLALLAIVVLWIALQAFYPGPRL